MKDKLNELRAVTEELGRIKGRHTELVSVYVPAGYGLPKVVEQNSKLSSHGNDGSLFGVLASSFGQG